VSETSRPSLVPVTGSEDAVATAFSPGSVAIVGASSRPGTLSWWPLHLTRTYGFSGPIYPVNPNRDEIDGLPCYRSIADIPGPVDLAVVALNADATPAAVAQLAEAGARVAVLPTQGLGELGEEGRRREAEMLAVAREAGLRIAGPNTDGVGNLQSGAIASIQPLFGEGVSAGPVALITQSGATAGSLLNRLKLEGIGVARYASTGNEIDLGLADYLSVALQDPNVEIVLSFVESIRKVDDFIAVAELAADLGKPLALIKVGRSEQAARRASAHTGALAGSDAVYDAVFSAHGIIRVDELSDLVAVAKLHLGGGIHGRGLGVLSVSGGQAGAVTDKAVRRGLQVPPISTETEERLSGLLTFGQVFNPCDLTGEVAKDATLAATVYEAFAGEEVLDAVVYARKGLTGDVGTAAAIELVAAAERSDTPLVIYAMDGQVPQDERDVYASQKVPVFLTLDDLFAGVAGLADHHEFLAQRAERPTTARKSTVPAALDLSRPFAELVAAVGLPLPGEIPVIDGDEAGVAAAKLGYPVVLKVADDRILHKTEAGGVALDLRDDEAVRRAFAAMLEATTVHLGGDRPAGFVVVEQVPEGVELIVGAKVDPDFGPVLLIGSGGVMAELLADVVLAPLPVDPDRVRQLLGQLRVGTLLEGFRGAGPADIDALVDTIVRFGDLVVALGDELVEADLNPVVALPAGQGVRILDTLAVAKEAS
jgi:acetyltransferase